MDYSQRWNRIDVALNAGATSDNAEIQPNRTRQRARRVPLRHVENAGLVTTNIVWPDPFKKGSKDWLHESDLLFRGDAADDSAE